MAAKNTSSIKKSLSLFKRHSTNKVKDVNDFLKDYAHLESLEDYRRDELLDLLKKLKVQVERYETCLDENSQHLIDEDTKLEEEKQNYDTLANEFEEVQDEHKKVKKDAFAFLDKYKTTNANVGATATGASSSKIDDTLKPKETLMRSMNLEEFNVWSDRFDAYYKQNEKILTSKNMSVRREVFFNCMEASLVQELRTDPTITDETPMIGDNSCLSKLKEIFLRNNPLFLRRYDFQECVQKPNQSFPEWWALKLTKGQDCDLENITRDEVLLLEMIRGVADLKLKEEFLKQQNPTLDGLKAIAEQWHSASYVSKHLNTESESVNVYKVKSTYKSQKLNDWSHDNKSQSQNSIDCTRCGDPKCKSWSDCVAKDAECYNCEKIGHFAKVCFFWQQRPSSRSQERPKERSKRSLSYAWSLCEE